MFMHRPSAYLQQIEPPPTVMIQNVRPQVDCGRYAVKREVGDTLRVTADIFKEGHDKIAAVLKLRQSGVETWTESEMTFVDNDMWAGEVFLPEIGRYEYTIEAFPDAFATWHDELTKKVAAGLDVTVELHEGRLIVERTRNSAAGEHDHFEMFHNQLERMTDQDSLSTLLLGHDLESLMNRHRPRDCASELSTPLPLQVDRVRARYASWYELFPRSTGKIEKVSATFRDVVRRLPEIEAMGFDVLYFTPIHPIGHTNRKGKNNSLSPQPGDPGVPYAIGNEHGGHDAIEPSLGSVEEFRDLVTEAENHGMEIALDLAIQASPDHPWAKSHPEWFHVRPDGSIKFAENPPKKYEDIFPINFSSEDWQGLWNELKRIILFWIDNGVKSFRVDNPHTKPFIFWEWLIDEVHRDHPDVIFLSEAFTRPKVMKTLAKVGFAQSYSYFTWRNFKQEIIDYFTELTQSDVVEYMRANLFPNTHDILPFILQQGARPAFKMRLALATTLSSVYGIYSGYELCENTPVPGKEEYLNSEKYEYRVWDWNRPGNIIDYVTLLNRVRREHPALQEYDSLRFYDAEDPNYLCYGKATMDRSDIILVVVNLDPFQTHETNFHFPVEEFGLEEGEQFLVTELVTEQSSFWSSGSQHVRLDPNWEPAMIYSIKRWAHVDYVETCG
jgi:starch synthase (maltosyl-transferring)